MSGRIARALRRQSKVWTEVLQAQGRRVTEREIYQSLKQDYKTSKK